VKRARENEEQVAWIKGLKQEHESADRECVAFDLIIIISGDEKIGSLSEASPSTSRATPEESSVTAGCISSAALGELWSDYRNWQESPLGSKCPPSARFGYCVYYLCDAIKKRSDIPSAATEVHDST
jgi:hypothetical protein